MGKLRRQRIFLKDAGSNSTAANARSQLHNQAVVSQLNAIGQPLVHLAVQPNVVAHVREIDTTRLHQTHNVQGGINRHVRRMLLLSQRIHHKQLNALNQFESLLRNIFCVGDISNVAYSIAVYQQLAMPYGQWGDLNSTAVKGFVVNLKSVENGCSGIGIFAEAVRHLLIQIVEHIAACKNGEMRRAVVAIRAKVVDAANVVVVGVGDDESIEVMVRRPQHLRTEIRSAINQYGFTFGAHNCRSTKSLVVLVARAAYPAFAAYLRHTG